MSHCMVLWCENKGQIPGISYFKLTKSRHDAWMEALGRNPNIEKLSCSNVVCSDHFTEENKIYLYKCVQLKSNAVPTLKLKKHGFVENQGYLNRNGKDPWVSSKHTRICSAHFAGGEKSNDPRKENYNPTVFPWKPEAGVAVTRKTGNMVTCHAANNDSVVGLEDLPEDSPPLIEKQLREISVQIKCDELEINDKHVHQLEENIKTEVDVIENKLNFDFKIKENQIKYEQKFEDTDRNMHQLNMIEINDFKIKSEEIDIKEEYEENDNKQELHHKSLTEDEAVKQHLLIDTGDSDGKQLLTHGEKKFKCVICEKLFTKKGNLKAHLLIHTGEKNFKCDICAKVFAQKDHLNKHLLIHTGEKNFKCNICNNSFTMKGNLKRHLLIHRDETNFECNICEKSFFVRTHLKRHLLSHSEKKFECSICEKLFTCNTTLNKHLLIHTGEKNFECNICHKSFTQNSSLNRHLLNHK